MNRAILSILTGGQPPDGVYCALVSRFVNTLAWACLIVTPCFPQTAWRWMVVAGENSASEHLCWVPNDSSRLIVVPGKEEECWTRIVRARGIEIDGPRSQGIAELCSTAGRTLGKPVEECLVPRIQSVFTTAQENGSGGIVQAPPDVAQILKKVAETYTAAKNYDLVEDMTDDKGSVTHERFAFKAPDRYRLEAAGPGLDFLLDSNAIAETVTVFDGTGAWIYLPKSNQYGFMPIASMTGNDREDVRPEAMDYFTMWHFRSAEELIGKARFLREEMAEIAGAKVDCYVLSVADSGSDTWWIDTKSYQVVRQAEKGASTVFTTIRLSESLPDDLFKFIPPPGAKKIDRQP